MKLVFADTLYWGAVLHPHDQYRAEVIRAREALGEISLVTTDEVLTELLVVGQFAFPSHVFPLTLLNHHGTASAL